MNEYFLLIIAVLIGLALIGMYNSLIAKKNQVENVFASLDALLKKRYDLIPNLVATVKGYMIHERELLIKVTELRAGTLSDVLSPDEKIGLDNQLTAALHRIFALSENYPELKASANFLQLQAALNEVEEQISAARRAYNAAVTDYNNAIEMFPSSVVAGWMRLQPRRWFEIAASERQNVDMSGSFR